MDTRDWQVPDVDSTQGSFTTDQSSTDVVSTFPDRSLSQHPLVDVTATSIISQHPIHPQLSEMQENAVQHTGSGDDFNLKTDRAVLTDSESDDQRRYVTGQEDDSNTDLSQNPIDEAALNVSQNAMHMALVELSVESLNDSSPVDNAIAEVSADFIKGEMMLSQHALSEGEEGGGKTSDDATRRALFERRTGGEGCYSVGTASTISDFTDNFEPLTTSHLQTDPEKQNHDAGGEDKKSPRDELIINSDKEKIDKNGVLPIDDKKVDLRSSRDSDPFMNSSNSTFKSAGFVSGMISDSLIFNPRHPIVHSTPYTVHHAKVIINPQESLKYDKSHKSDSQENPAVLKKDMPSSLASSVYGKDEEDLLSKRKSWEPPSAIVRDPLEESRRVSDPSQYQYSYRMPDLEVKKPPITTAVPTSHKEGADSDYMTVEERARLMSGDADDELAADRLEERTSGFHQGESTAAQRSSDTSDGQQRVPHDSGHQPKNTRDLVIDDLSSHPGEDQYPARRVSTPVKSAGQSTERMDANVMMKQPGAFRSLSPVTADLSSERVKPDDPWMDQDLQLQENKQERSKYVESAVRPEKMYEREKVMKDSAVTSSDLLVEKEKRDLREMSSEMRSDGRAVLSQYRMEDRKTPVEDWLRSTPDNMQDYGELSDVHSSGAESTSDAGRLEKLAVRSHSVDAVRKLASTPHEDTNKDPGPVDNPVMQDDYLVSPRTTSTIYQDLPHNVKSDHGIEQMLTSIEQGLAPSGGGDERQSQDVSISPDVEHILRKYNVMQEDLDKLSLPDSHVDSDIGMLSVSARGLPADEQTPDVIGRATEIKSDINDSGLKSLSIPTASDAGSEVIGAGASDVGTQSIDTPRSDKHSVEKADSDISNVDSLSQRVRQLLSGTSYLENKAAHITDQGALNYDSLQRDLDEIQNNLKVKDYTPSKSHDTSLNTPRESFPGDVDSELDRSKRLYWDHGADLDYQEDGNFVGTMQEVERAGPDGSSGPTLLPTAASVAMSTAIQPLLTSSIVPVDVAMDLLMDSSADVAYNRKQRESTHYGRRDRDGQYSSTQNEDHLTKYDSDSDYGHVGYQAVPEPPQGLALPLYDSEDSAYMRPGREEEEDDDSDHREVPKFHFNSDESLTRKVNELLNDTPVVASSVQKSQRSNRRLNNTDEMQNSYLDYRSSARPREDLAAVSSTPAETSAYNTSLSNTTPGGARSLSASFAVSPIPRGPLSTLSQARTFLSSQLAKANDFDFDRSIELRSPLRRRFNEDRYKDDPTSLYDLDTNKGHGERKALVTGADHDVARSDRAVGSTGHAYRREASGYRPDDLKSDYSAASQMRSSEYDSRTTDFSSEDEVSTVTTETLTTSSVVDSHMTARRTINMARPLVDSHTHRTRSERPPLPSPDPVRGRTRYETKAGTTTSCEFNKPQDRSTRLTINKASMLTEGDRTRLHSASNLRPYKRPGVTGDFYYVDSGQDDALSVAPSDATVESSHPGSDDAQAPLFPRHCLGSRTDPPQTSAGIYNKTSPSPPPLSTIHENKSLLDKDRSIDETSDDSVHTSDRVSQRRSLVEDDTDVGVVRNRPRPRYSPTRDPVIDNDAKNDSMGQSYLSMRNLKDSVELTTDRLRDRHSQRPLSADSSRVSSTDEERQNEVHSSGRFNHYSKSGSYNSHSEARYYDHDPDDVSLNRSKYASPDVSVLQRSESPSYSAGSWRAEKAACRTQPDLSLSAAPRVMNASHTSPLAQSRPSTEFRPLPVDEDSPGSQRESDIHSIINRHDHSGRYDSTIKSGASSSMAADMLQLQPKSLERSRSPGINHERSKSPKTHIDMSRSQKLQTDMLRSPVRPSDDSWKYRESHEPTVDFDIPSKPKPIRAWEIDHKEYSVKSDKNELKVEHLRKDSKYVNQSENRERENLSSSKSSVNKANKKQKEQNKSVTSSSSDEPPPRNAVKVLRDMMQQEVGSRLSQSKNINDLWERFQELNRSTSDSDVSSYDVNLQKLSSLLRNPVSHFVRHQLAGEKQRPLVTHKESDEEGSLTSLERDLKSASIRSQVRQKSSVEQQGSKDSNTQQEKCGKSDNVREKGGDDKIGQGEGTGQVGGQGGVGGSGGGGGGGGRDNSGRDDDKKNDGTNASKSEKKVKVKETKKQDRRESVESHRPLSSTPTPPQTDSDVSTVTPDITPRAQLLPRFGREETLTSIPEDTTLDSLTSITSHVTASSDFEMTKQRAAAASEARLLRLQQKIKRQKEKYERERLREQRRKEKIRQLEQMLKQNADGGKENTIEFESTTSSVSTSTTTDTTAEQRTPDSQLSVSTDTTLEDHKQYERKMRIRRLAMQEKMEEEKRKKAESVRKQKAKKTKIESPSFELQQVDYKIENKPQREADVKLKEKDKRKERPIKEVYKPHSSYFEFKKPKNPVPKKVKSDKKHKKESVKETPVRSTRDAAQNFPSPMVVSPPTVREVREVLMVSEAVQTAPEVNQEPAVIVESPKSLPKPQVPSVDEENVSADKPSMFTPETPETSVSQSHQTAKALAAKIGTGGLAWYVPAEVSKPEWRKPLRERQAYTLTRDPWPPTLPASLPQGLENLPLNEAEIYLTRTAPTMDGDGSHAKTSLQEALEQRRSDFVSRSRERVKKLKLAADERRMQDHLSLERNKLFKSRKALHANANAHPLSEHHHKPQKRRISKQQMIEHTNRIYNKLPEVMRQADEKKRERNYQTNRLRAAIYKKRLQDRIINKRAAWIEG